MHFVNPLVNECIYYLFNKKPNFANKSSSKNKKYSKFLKYFWLVNLNNHYSLFQSINCAKTNSLNSLGKTNLTSIYLVK